MVGDNHKYSRVNQPGVLLPNVWLFSLIDYFPNYPPNHLQSLQGVTFSFTISLTRFFFTSPDRCKGVDTGVVRLINRQLARTDLTSRPTDADSLNGTCRKADHCFTTIRTEVTTTTVYLLHATAIGIPRWLLWLLATFARIPGTMLTFVLTDCARV